MTIDEAVNIWMPVVAMGVKDMPEVKEAVRMSIKSLEAWEAVRQDIQTETDNKSNNMYFNLGMLGALAIINKHLQEVRCRNEKT